MHTCTRICTVFIIAFIVCAPPLQAQLQFLETDNLRLIYLDGLHSFIAPHVARCFENAMRFHQRHWQYTLPEKVTVFVHDLGDHANGAAKNIPRDLMLVGIAPFNYVYETMPANERVNTIMNHELVHIYTMDRASSWDKFYRGLFRGKPEPIAANPLSIIYDYLCTPRRSAPRWYQEGIAVFLETWMAGGYGRALGAYDEMVFRTLILDSARFYYPVGLEAEGTKVDFHVGVNSYLYGTRFFSHLAVKYGPDRVMQWVNRTNDSKAYFLSQFNKTFGVSLHDEWAQWLAAEHDWQERNLARIRQYPVTPHRDITGEAVGSISRACYDPASRKIYAAINYPGRLAHLAAIDIETGAIARIRDLSGPALFFVSSLIYDSTTQSLFYTTNNYGWRDLRVTDVRTGESRLLLKHERIGDLAFNPADKSLWGVRHFNGISTLVRIPHPYREWNTIFVWPYGKDLYDIDISPDGARISGALAQVSGRQQLIMMEIEKLLAGDSTYAVLHDFGNSTPGCFVFSPDGRHLYGSSYFTGVANIFRYDIAADSMDCMSNCETGFFRPVPLGHDSLIVFRYTAKGFKPAIIPDQSLEDVNAIRYLGQEVVEQHPVVKAWMVGSPGEINLDSLTRKTGPYRTWQNIRPVSAYPIVEGYKDYTAVGVRIDLSDHLTLLNADVTASYTPSAGVAEDERWHVSANSNFGNWHVSFTYNAADFYDLFGPTKTSRKGYSLGLVYQRSLLYDAPRELNWSVNLTGYGGLERLPDYQNISASYDEFLVASSELEYKNLRASLGAVDYEKGYKVRLMTGNTLVHRTHYPYGLLTTDYGIPLPVHHAAFWFRTATGYAHGDRNDPFANFYFGGFGNNWVDHRPEKRYRDFYGLPGLELNEIGGTNFGKATLELALPPLRFRRLGFPALYCSWARAAIFGTGLATNFNKQVRADHWAYSSGTQVDFRFQLLSHLRLTFSAGYGLAWKGRLRPSEEFMFSLKVL